MARKDKKEGDQTASEKKRVALVRTWDPRRMRAALSRDGWNSERKMRTRVGRATGGQRWLLVGASDPVALVPAGIECQANQGQVLVRRLRVTYRAAA